MITPWGIVRWLFRRCPAWKIAPGDLGIPERLYCTKDLPHWGMHENHYFNQRWL